jgi:hypothetical protein
MRDAIVLAEKLDRHDDVRAALHAYQQERRADLVIPQQAALASTRWFENVPRHIDDEPTQFAYELWKRRGHCPLWRYQLHLATQIAAVRRARCSVSAMLRELRARRRVRLADSYRRVRKKDLQGAQEHRN